jgi:lipopolysaccharide O-acetyltransferase
MNALLFYKENGLFVLIQEAIRRLNRKIFNFFLALRLKGAKKLDVSPSSYLRGLSHMKIGRHFRSGEHLRLEAITGRGDQEFNPQIIIKDNVEVNDFVHIGATNYVEIGSNVLIASKVYISDHNHGAYSGGDQASPDTPPKMRAVTNDRKVIIGGNVWIGESVSVLPGVTIGEGSVIGANSVVTKDVPRSSIAAGSPAKVIKKYDSSLKKWIAVPER